jgi:hypothetical protein
VFQTDCTHILFSDEEQHGVFVRNSRGRICAIVENRYIGEYGSGALRVYHLLSPVGTSPESAYGATDDHIESACLFAGKKQNLFTREAAFRTASG